MRLRGPEAVLSHKGHKLKVAKLGRGNYVLGRRAIGQNKLEFGQSNTNVIKHSHERARLKSRNRMKRIKKVICTGNTRERYELTFPNWNSNRQ